MDKPAERPCTGSPADPRPKRRPARGGLGARVRVGGVSGPAGVLHLAVPDPGAGGEGRAGDRGRDSRLPQDGRGLDAGPGGRGWGSAPRSAGSPEGRRLHGKLVERVIFTLVAQRALERRLEASGRSLGGRTGGDRGLRRVLRRPGRPAGPGERRRCRPAHRGGDARVRAFEGLPSRPAAGGHRDNRHPGRGAGAVLDVPGNTADTSIIRTVKDDLAGWNLRRLVWVADRGFASTTNRAYLTKGGGHYIHAPRSCGTPTPRLPRHWPGPGGTRPWRGTCGSRNCTSPGGDCDGAGGVRTQRFVVCHNPEQADRDAVVCDHLAHLTRLVAGSDSWTPRRRAATYAAPASACCVSTPPRLRGSSELCMGRGSAVGPGS